MIKIEQLVKSSWMERKHRNIRTGYCKGKGLLLDHQKGGVKVNEQVRHNFLYQY